MTFGDVNRILQAERLSLKVYFRSQRWHAVLKPYPSSGQDEMHGKGVSLEDAIGNVFSGFGVSTRGGEGSRKGRYDPSLKTDKGWPGWGRQHAGYAASKAKSVGVEGGDVDLDIREVQNASIPRMRRPSKSPEVPDLPSSFVPTTLTLGSLKYDEEEALLAAAQQGLDGGLAYGSVPLSKRDAESLLWFFEDKGNRKAFDAVVPESLSRKLDKLLGRIRAAGIAAESKRVYTPSVYGRKAQELTEGLKAKQREELEALRAETAQRRQEMAWREGLAEKKLEALAAEGAPRSVRPAPPAEPSRAPAVPPEPEPSEAEGKEAIKAARAARRAAKGQKKPGRKPGPEAQVAAEQAAFDALVARVEAKEAARQEEAPPPREEPTPRAATKRTATGERVSLPDAPRPGKLPF